MRYVPLEELVRKLRRDCQSGGSALNTLRVKVGTLDIRVEPYNLIEHTTQRVLSTTYQLRVKNGTASNKWNDLDMDTIFKSILDNCIKYLSIYGPILTTTPTVVINVNYYLEPECWYMKVYQDKEAWFGNLSYDEFNLRFDPQHLAVKLH